MLSSGLDISHGRWTDLETVLLMVMMETVASVYLPMTSSNFCELFNYVVSSPNVVDMKLPFQRKQSMQIVGKVKNISGKQDIIQSLIYPACNLQDWTPLMTA